MKKDKKYTERPLPYSADAIVVEYKPKKKANIKFKAYKFMDGYFDFLEVNSLTVMGYRLVTRNNMEDTLYVAYKPMDCDVNRLISETRRWFKNVYREDVVDIVKTDKTLELFNSTYRIFTDYVLAGFKMPIASYAEEFETYLMDELHLSEEVAIGHADNLEMISKMTWRSTKPANNVYRKNPADIDKYVSSLYLNDENEKVFEKTLKTTLTLFLRYMQFRHDQYQKRLSGYHSTLVTPKVVIKAPEEKTIVIEKPVVKEITDAKTIRIDINMDDIDEFLDYLEKREPNRQQRERYKKQLEELYQSGWNQYKHNTFIDDNKYKVNAKDIEVFVNGMKSRDFNVTVKEYEDTIELYLSYRWTKKYSPAKKTDKEEAIPPQYKIRAEKEEPKKDNNTEGKKIFATINHYDSWKSKEEPQPPEMEATTQYLGEASGQRKSASMKNAVITEDENTVNIKMELNGNSLIPSDDEKGNPEDSIEKQNSQEEEENKPVEQENAEGSGSEGKEEPQMPPTEVVNPEKPSDEIDNDEEEDKPLEQIEITDNKDKPAPTVQKRKRKKGWFRRIIEKILSWLFK